MVAMALSLACAGNAFAGNDGHSSVSAAQHGSLHSLRGAMYRPDDFAKSPHAHPLHPLPMLDGAGNQVDAAVQGTASGPAAPALGSGVPGLGNGFTGPNGSFTVNSAPPDTTGAVGATQYVQVVNSGLAIFDKATKNVVYGPVPTNTLWQTLGGPCAADNDGDAVVIYDRAAQRWVISQFAVTAAPYYQCVAVSKTSDATGGYWLYAFNYGSVFPDYPKMGAWPDAYYITFNMFNGNTFAGAKLCAYDRAKMLTGAAATQQCFQLSTSYGGVLPADVDGSTAPPAGSPNYLVNFGASTLNLWKFHVDWVNTANTTLTGPTSIPVATFATACGGGTCVPQLGTSQKLDSLADRLMFRFAYRNFGTHESLVVTHSVKVGTTRRDPYVGVRWYELRNPNGTPVVYQQSTFSPDNTYRWMASAAMDKQGNMAVGYSVSSSSIYPGIRYTGRLATDPLNVMQPESTIINGLGAQTGSNLARWGDYSTMTVDPADDCTFWYSTEYLRTNGAFNWSTQIASFKFPGCV
ncbi:MAG: hypothetical protein HOQ02_11830 [Lysobacter sp.]|nr:hypothetical protein [Lysobacter sp.]